jgi:hypothetical protein
MSEIRKNQMGLFCFMSKFPNSFYLRRNRFLFRLCLFWCEMFLFYFKKIGKENISCTPALLDRDSVQDPPRPIGRQGVLHLILIPPFLPSSHPSQLVWPERRVSNFNDYDTRLSFVSLKYIYAYSFLFYSFHSRVFLCWVCAS